MIMRGIEGNRKETRYGEKKGGGEKKDKKNHIISGCAIFFIIPLGRDGGGFEKNQNFFVPWFKNFDNTGRRRGCGQPPAGLSPFFYSLRYASLVVLLKLIYAILLKSPNFRAAKIIPR